MQPLLERRTVPCSISRSFHNCHFLHLVSLWLWCCLSWVIFCPSCVFFFYVLIRQISVSSCRQSSQISENVFHFSSITLMLSTVSAVLLAASYPNLYSLHHLTLLSILFSLRNTTLSGCILSCSKNQFYVLIRICQHIFLAHQFIPYQFALLYWLRTPDQLL